MTAPNPNAEGLRDDTPVCPFCNSARHDSERLRDGNVMQTADLVDAMLNVWLNAGELEFPADLNRTPQFPQDYSDGAQSLFRAKMKAALGTAIRNMPYLAALRDIADTSLERAGEMVSLPPDPEDTASVLDTSTLKPCPFCGRWAHTAGYQNDTTKIYVFKVICTGCNTTTLGNSRNKAEARSLAISTWQNRAGPRALPLTTEGSR